MGPSRRRFLSTRGISRKCNRRHCRRPLAPRTLQGRFPMSRQQLAALNAQRGPPTELMVQGASNYRFEQAKTASKTAGRPSGSFAPADLTSARAALAEAEARFAEASAPVCIHDLKETAMRTQRLVEEKERMVRAAPRPARIAAGASAFPRSADAPPPQHTHTPLPRRCSASKPTLWSPCPTAAWRASARA